MKVHFIAIGGSAMHNLAIALKKKGFEVSGSDDEVFEPSKSRLGKYGLLPEKQGWNENNITNNLDAVILGMHARKDNPELLKAEKTGLKIYSYPEYIFNQSQNKKRVVIAGSHGKTTITAMILHVLQQTDTDFDYMVGAQLEGFDTMVKLTDAPLIILEGDEYLSSPIDLRSKFLWYKPHIAVITGIAWDHINVFPTFENYKKQFVDFVESIENNGKVIYFQEDANLSDIVNKSKSELEKIAYQAPKYSIDAEKVFVENNNERCEVNVFGKHNLQNINAARLVCNNLGIEDNLFFKAIKSFRGAAKRLELVAENERVKIYKDFAHAPSKLKATTAAAKEMYPNKILVACIELHTFSSLNKDFLPQYKNTLQAADKKIVYFNPHTLKHKKLPPIGERDILKAFDDDSILVFTDSKKCIAEIERNILPGTIILMMTSGNFDGLDINTWASIVVGFNRR